MDNQDDSSDSEYWSDGTEPYTGVVLREGAVYPSGSAVVHAAQDYV